MEKVNQFRESTQVWVLLNSLFEMETCSFPVVVCTFLYYWRLIQLLFDGGRSYLLVILHELLVPRRPKGPSLKIALTSVDTKVGTGKVSIYITPSLVILFDDFQPQTQCHNRSWNQSNVLHTLIEVSSLPRSRLSDHTPPTTLDSETYFGEGKGL